MCNTRAHIVPLMHCVAASRQANGEGGTQRLYTGLLDCIGKTYRCEGIRGFYLGCTANVVRMIPTGAIQHAAYSFFKGMLDCT